MRDHGRKSTDAGDPATPVIHVTQGVPRSLGPPPDLRKHQSDPVTQALSRPKIHDHAPDLRKRKWPKWPPLTGVGALERPAHTHPRGRRQTGTETR